MVVDGSAHRSKFLQTSHFSKAQHGPFSSSEQEVRIFRPVVWPAPGFLPWRVADDFHRSAIRPRLTRRRGSRIRYYVSNRLISGGTDPSGWRLPAPPFETAVAKVIVAHLNEQARSLRITDIADLEVSQNAATAAENLVTRVSRSGATIAAMLITSGTIARGRVRITLERGALADDLPVSAEALNADLCKIDSAFTCKRRGVELKIISFANNPDSDC